jgi:hypothetical protein
LNGHANERDGELGDGEDPSSTHRGASLGDGRRFWGRFLDRSDACRIDRASLFQQSDELCVFVDAAAFGDERGGAVMRRVIFGLAVLVLMATWKPTPVATAPPREAAADTLAAQGKLFCHRTFRATSWIVATGFPSAYREADQDANDTLCGFKTDGYWAMYSTVGVPTVGPGMNGLPAVEVTGSAGIFNLSIFPGSGPGTQGQLTGRIGYRWYFRMGDTDACEAAKITQIGMYWSFITADYRTGVSGAGTNGGLAWQGAGEGVEGLSSRMFRGKWWRLEFYVDTYENPKSVSVYAKNITDNGPEYLRTVYSMCQGTWCVVDHKKEFTDFIHMYREAGRAVPGLCTNRFMYALAAKNLGPNERIPPAVELEGGSGGSGTVATNNAPSAPAGLTVR